MSDVWQGPGWWLASDGKWYPADAAPGNSTDAAGSVQTKVEPTTSTIIEAPNVEPDVEPDAEPVVEADPEPGVEADDQAEALADPFVELAAEPTAFAEPAAFVEPVVEPFDTGFDEGAGTNVAASSETETIGGWQSIVEPTETSEPVEPAGQWAEPAAPAGVDADGGWSSGYEERQPVPADATPVDDLEPPGAPVEPRPESEITDAVLPDVAPTETIVRDVELPDGPIADTPTPEVPISEVGLPDPEVPDLGMPPPAPGVEPIAHAVPDADIPEVPAPPSIDMTDRIANGEKADEIHRDGAWRKPNGDTETVLRVPAGEGEGAASSASPDVVDLAIPSESPLHPPIESGGGGRSIGMLGAAAVVAVVVGLALLIGWLFTRGDDGELAVDDTPTVTVSSTQPGTTASSAPSTEEPTSSSTTAVIQDEEVSVFDLRAGDCIKNEIGQGQVQRLVRVDCAIPHEFEVYREALIDSTITDFDEELISAQAQEVCGSSLTDYISPSDTRDLKFKWFQPTADSWSQEENPDRVITCLLFDESGPLTGRAA